MSIANKKILYAYIGQNNFLFNRNVIKTLNRLPTNYRVSAIASDIVSVFSVAFQNLKN